MELIEVKETAYEFTCIVASEESESTQTVSCEEVMLILNRKL